MLKTFITEYGMHLFILIFKYKNKLLFNTKLFSLIYKTLSKTISVKYLTAIKNKSLF